jgi:hypothetical protein
MAYHREEEVRRLIENYACWMGDGVVQSRRGCIVLRALRGIRCAMGEAELPNTLGIEAGHTQAALNRLAMELHQALMVFHTSDLTFELQARQRARCSKSTYHRRLAEAHPLFIAEFEDQVIGAKQRSDARIAHAVGIV